MSAILSVDEAFYVHTVEHYLEIGTYDMYDQWRKQVRNDCVFCEYSDLYEMCDQVRV